MQQLMFIFTRVVVTELQVFFGFVFMRIAPYNCD